MTRTILILGATGGIGGAVARIMLERGWQVRALARDPEKARQAWTRGPGPQWLRGDAMVRDDVVRAAAGSDVILHAVNPTGYRDWDRLVLPMIRNTIEAARAAGGARVVLPGTVYNYDPSATSVIDETTQQNPTSCKGTIRAELETLLSAAAPEVPSLVVRAGDFFGPGARQSWFSQSLARQPLKRIVDPGRRGTGHAWAYLPDLAETMARLIELPAGRLRPAERVQFAGYWDADGTGMASAIRTAAGRPGLPARRFLWWLMRLVSPFGGFPREVMEVRPFWRLPLRLDNTRLVMLLGEEPRTALADAVATTLDVS